MPTASELRELDDEELQGRLDEYRRELLNLRFQLATGQLDNVARIPGVRRDVARVLTIMRDREIALAEGRPIEPVVSTRRRRVEEEDEFEVEASAPRARRRRAPARQAADEAVLDHPEDADDADEAIAVAEVDDDLDAGPEDELDEGLDEVDEIGGIEDVDEAGGADEEDG